MMARTVNASGFRKAIFLSSNSFCPWCMVHHLYRMGALMKIVAKNSTARTGISAATFSNCRRTSTDHSASVA